MSKSNSSSSDSPNPKPVSNERETPEPTQEHPGLAPTQKLRGLTEEPLASPQPLPPPQSKPSSPTASYSEIDADAQAPWDIPSAPVRQRPPDSPAADTMVLKVDDILEEHEKQDPNNESPASLLPPKALPPLDFESTNQVDTPDVSKPEPTSIDAIRGRETSSDSIELGKTGQTARPQGTMELDLNDMIEEETPAPLSTPEEVQQNVEGSTSPEQPAATPLLEAATEPTSPSKPAAVPHPLDNEPTQQVRLNPEMAAAILSPKPLTESEPGLIDEEEELQDRHTLDARPVVAHETTQETVLPEELQTDIPPDTKIQPIPPDTPLTSDAQSTQERPAARPSRRTRSSVNNPNPFASLLEEASQSQTELAQVDEPVASKPESKPAPIAVVQKKPTPVPLFKPPAEPVQTFTVDDDSSPIPLRTQKPMFRQKSPLDEEDIQVTVNDMVDMELDDDIKFLDDEPEPPASTAHSAAPTPIMGSAQPSKPSASPFPPAGSPSQRMVGFPTPQPVPSPPASAPLVPKPASAPPTPIVPPPAAAKEETPLEAFPTKQEAPAKTPLVPPPSAPPPSLKPAEETPAPSPSSPLALLAQDTEIEPPNEEKSPKPNSFPTSASTAPESSSLFPKEQEPLLTGDLQETLPLDASSPVDALAETVPPLDLASAPTENAEPRPVSVARPQPPPSNSGILIAILCLGLGLMLITIYFFFL
ncbi:MAG: hypothetical protein EP343_06820 [Deltaproteobacteria bacterium]|nr:MAG: hypothetical protein EP343_06820 [Deltaproteobacteria bacterium]